MVVSGNNTHNSDNGERISLKILQFKEMFRGTQPETSSEAAMDRRMKNLFAHRIEQPDKRGKGLRVMYTDLHKPVDLCALPNWSMKIGESRVELENAYKPKEPTIVLLSENNAYIKNAYKLVKAYHDASRERGSSGAWTEYMQCVDSIKELSKHVSSKPERYEWIPKVKAAVKKVSERELRIAQLVTSAEKAMKALKDVPMEDVNLRVMVRDAKTGEFATAWSSEQEAKKQ